MLFALNYEIHGVLPISDSDSAPRRLTSLSKLRIPESILLLCPQEELNLYDLAVTRP